MFCAACEAAWPVLPEPRCGRCAGPMATDCRDCARLAPSFGTAIALGAYSGVLREGVHSLKYRAQRHVAAEFADRLVASSDFPAGTWLVVPVPLTKTRLKERGFNQALEIARPLSRALGIRLERRMAVRTRETGAQSLLPPEQRRRNMRHAFSVPGEAIEKIRGRHVGVVDDVITTGATLNELAATLKHYGAARVTNLVFARTPH